MEGDEHGGELLLFGGVIRRGLPAMEVSSPFFNYGEGFFETLLFRGGKLCHYDAHLERMRRTCGDFAVDLSFEEVAEPVVTAFLEKAGFSGKLCRVKFLYAPLGRGNCWKTVVTAAPYSPPAGELTLSIHHERRDTALARYKMINYMANRHWRGHYARREGSDEVLFRGASGAVLEGSYTNILYRTGETLHYTDKSAPYLAGIMQEKLLDRAAASGWDLKGHPEGLMPEALSGADEVVLTNSLMGVRGAGTLIREGRRHDLSGDGKKRIKELGESL